MGATEPGGAIVSRVEDLQRQLTACQAQRRLTEEVVASYRVRIAKAVDELMSLSTVHAVTLEQAESDRRAARVEADRVRDELAAAQARIDQLEQALDEAHAKVEAIQQTIAWRIVRPLRAVRARQLAAARRA